MRLLRIRRPSTGQRLLIGLMLVLGLSLLRGVATFGVQQATNEFREFLTFLAPALYLSTFPVRDLRDRIAAGWQAIAATLVAIAVLRWANVLTGVPIGLFALREGRSIGAGQQDSLRVVPSDDALLILQALLIVGSLWIASFRSQERGDMAGVQHLWIRWSGRLSAVFLFSVLLLQHRTIWVATLFSVAVGVALMEKQRLTVPAVLTGVMVLGFASGLALANTGGELIPDPLRGQFEYSATNQNTFVWRFEGWLDLAESSGETSAVDKALGRPFGSGYSRVVDGQLVEVNPHNTYLTFFLRSGFVGLALLLAMYAWVIRRLLRSGHGAASSDTTALSNRVLVVLLTSQLVYWATYNPFVEQGLLLGLGLSVVIAANTEEFAEPASRSITDRDISLT